MPDFEALIRHQQIKQPATNQRLKVVDSADLEEKNAKTIITKSRLLVNFFGGFAGSVVGTLLIPFLYVNDFLSMDFLKI